MSLKRLIAGILVSTAMCASAAADQAVQNIRFGVDGDRTRIVVETSEPVDFNAFTVDGLSNRLVIELPQSAWQVSGLETGEGMGHGVVGQFRFFNSTTASRLVFELDRPAVVVEEFRLGPQSSGGHYRAVIDLQRTTENDFRIQSGFQQNQVLTNLIADRVEAVYTPPPRERRVIVVDAGHGGRDPGAIGVSGTYEKTVALAAALELKAQLESTGRYEVYLTRSDDTFLTLPERVDVAARHQADLFLSIHADVSASAGTRGAAVYTLNDRAEGRAERIAQRDADPNRSTEVNNILISLGLREKRNQSEAFADVLLDNLSQAGPLLTNPHRQENFYVLLDSRVPAVLLEMGFLTNRTDEANLMSASVRRRQMAAVVEGLDEYFATRGDENDTARHASLQSAR